VNIPVGLRGLGIGLAAILLLTIIVLGIRALFLVWSLHGYANYWKKLASQPVASNAITITVLGDSLAQAIGASNPRQGFVAKIADHISQTTGRPVRIINLSKSGAKVADVRYQQLPQVAATHPDIVLVEVGANDVIHHTSTHDFESNFSAVLNALPADRTAVATITRIDSPRVKAKPHVEAKWDQFIAQQVQQCHMQLADAYSQFLPIQHNLRAYGGDFFHPSNYGYLPWTKAFAPAVDVILGRLAK
jgi:lysophospholipase L1-like esterase